MLDEIIIIKQSHFVCGVQIKLWSLRILRETLLHDILL